MVVAATSGPLYADSGFYESFSTDPLATGRWWMMAGENASRFTYQPAEGKVAAAYDSGLPTARLVRSLGRMLDKDDSFLCTVKFAINSTSFHADAFGNAEISFGFLNTNSTGPDRAGFSSAPKAFDVLTWDYFPNENDVFGGPSLAPTIISSSQGQGFFSAIDFVANNETRLDDPGEVDLPKNVQLTAVIRYRGDTRKATLQMYQGSTPLLINASGGLDGDAFTITTPLTDVGFAVNAFGLLLWKDTWSNQSIVVAGLVYDEIEVVAPEFGDFDRDADVDAEDWGIFQGCQSGPAMAAVESCKPCDADDDGDVDGADFGVFQRNVTGAR